MYDLDTLVKELTENNVVVLNDRPYEVNNCVVGISEESMKVVAYIKNQYGMLLRVAIESINLRK